MSFFLCNPSVNVQLEQEGVANDFPKRLKVRVNTVEVLKNTVKTALFWNRIAMTVGWDDTNTNAVYNIINSAKK